MKNMISRNTFIFIVFLTLTGCEANKLNCPEDENVCSPQNQSIMLQYSTDPRLMRDMEPVGNLDNGMTIYSWSWNNKARNINEKYGSNSKNGGHASIGLITRDIKKLYPNAVFIRSDGYEQINEAILRQNDQFINKKILASENSTRERCAKILETSYVYCF